jgi:hypothetical protein
VISRGTSHFWQCYRELPTDIKAAARNAYRKFAEDQSHPSLRVERLRSDSRAWSVRVTKDYRAVALREKDTWLWVWIGSHAEFDRRFPG